MTRERRSRPTRALGLALALALAVTAPTVAACGTDGTGTAAGADERLRVVATVAPITSIVAAVAGDRVDIEGLVPEGTNSHTFEPPPSAAEALARADLVIMNGLQLETPTRELAAKVANDAELVELGDAALPAERWVYDESFPADEGKPNPHLWTDPPLARRYAELVHDALVRHDPDGAATYRANLDAFAARVDELDRAMRTAFATIPRERRKLLTYHDAFAYFARDYDWDVIGAIQVGDHQEPSAAEVAALVDQIRSEGVTAIFGSEVFPSPVLEQLGRETGVRYVDTLRDDDLPGAPGAPEHSLLGLLRVDYVTMTEALGGDASALKAADLTLAVPDRAHYPQ